MLKMIIVDDEEPVLDMLSVLIDWEQMGIRLIGTCNNGIDAYQMIVDNEPDIVLTDVRMPGLTGVELIGRLKEAQSDAEFIILSGFGEFEYAQKAMQYGVRHYLLKPCNEKQIMEAVEDLKKTCYEKRALFKRRNELANVLESYVVENLLFECISQHEELEQVKRVYEPIVDFYTMDYEVCYFHYLEETKLSNYLESIKQCVSGANGYFLYVAYTLVVFFPGFHAEYEALDEQCTCLAESHGMVYRRESYGNLSELLTTLIAKLNRYEAIRFLCDGHEHKIYNHQALVINTKKYVDQLVVSDALKRETILKELERRILAVSDVELLRVLFSNMLVQLYSRMRSDTDFTQVMPVVEQLNVCMMPRDIYRVIQGKIQELFSVTNPSPVQDRDSIERMIQYTKQHLDDPSLSVRKLAKDYLYMNPDYVGRQFQKRTGMKYSTYLSNLRMERAKELLKENGAEKIYIIAEAVGCENNPQYFSQLFKKYTGMTPTQYAKSIQKEE